MHGHMSRARSHVTMQHGHMSRCSTVTCHDAARSHVTMQHGHMSRCSTVTCHDARSHVTLQHGYMNVKKKIKLSSLQNVLYMQNKKPRASKLIS